MPSKTRYFNPRSPHGERPLIARRVNAARLFQPTLPARGATKFVVKMLVEKVFQPTLPARGATSSRARPEWRQTIFQPTLPARGATPADSHGSRKVLISTHAPRTGSDAPLAAKRDWRAISTHAPRTGSDEDETRHAATSGNFNPRSPHGERRGRGRAPRRPRGISTHAPRTGSDGY